MHLAKCNGTQQILNVDVVVFLASGDAYGRGRIDDMHRYHCDRIIGDCYTPGTELLVKRDG